MSKTPLLPWSDVLNLTRPFDRPFGSGAKAELCMEPSCEKMWSSDALYFLMVRHGAGYLYKYQNGSSLPIVGREDRSIASFSLHGTSLVITSSSCDSFEELILIEDQVERRISGWNDHYYQTYSWAKTEKRYFRSSTDDVDLEGWLTYPLSYQSKERYPLVHFIHGGPHAAWGPAFSFMAQLFAAKGYFVLLTNPRGSTSYGQSFSSVIDGDWGNLDMRDILSGLDDAEQTDSVDPQNCYLYGWSYGGYLACWIATQSKRYRAICSGAPVVDMCSDYGTADITLANEWEYGASPWSNAKHLNRHSSLHYAHLVETPLLMLHGESDLRCPIMQTELFYSALKRLEKTVVMIRYKDESHIFKKPQNLVDRYDRILAWFDYYIAKGVTVD